MNHLIEIERSAVPLRLLFEKTKQGEITFELFSALVKLQDLNPSETLKKCPRCDHRTLSWDARGRAFICLTHKCTHSERLFEA